LANNVWGTIVGYYTDENVVPHAFIRSPGGSIQSFNAPGAGLGHGLNEGTVAVSINDENEIAGQYEDSKQVYHGFVRFTDGSITSFEAPDADTRRLPRLRPPLPRNDRPL
jgi:hypothetical protein